MSDLSSAIGTILFALSSAIGGVFIWTVPALLIGGITGLVVRSTNKAIIADVAVKIGFTWFAVTILAGLSSFVLNFLFNDLLNASTLITWIWTCAPLAVLCPLIGGYYTFKWLDEDSNTGILK